MRKQQLILFLLLTMFFQSHRIYGQQDPMYTQYNFNMQTINAGYAGTWDRLGLLVLGRYQWVGMTGAPTTYTFSLQSPTRWENVALGLNVIQDKVGREKRLTISGDYSYRVQISSNTDLRLGVKGGITNYSNPLTEYTPYPDGESEVYSENIDAKTLPNVGVGAFLHSDRYYIGLSVPKILQTDLDSGDGSYTTYSEMCHFFFSAGYVFHLGENLEFKPTTMIKAVEGSPVQFDLTANFLIRERFWLGGMYRIGDAFGFIGQFVLQEHIRFGYAIDFTTTDLQNYHNGTHEFMISYEFGSRKRWTTPRMF